MHTWALVAAAGQGTRFDPSGGKAKQFLEWQGIPLFWHSVRTFARLVRIQGIVLVFPATAMEEAAALVAHLRPLDCLEIPVITVCGGASRQDSVRAGLAALPDNATHVLVHDAARPFFSARLASQILEKLEQGCKGVVPGIELADTVKSIDASGRVLATPERSSLRAVQTPQGFAVNELCRCHQCAKDEDFAGTDDASLLERCGVPVSVIPGEETNRKLTNPDDMRLLRAEAAHAAQARVGFGYDVHRYGGNRPLKLGGVPIPGDIAVHAHSDGDVLLHALTDAVLGCTIGGDIGALFPDSDPNLDNASSGMLLAEAVRRAEAEGYRISGADLTIVAQVPKVSPHRERIAANVASLLGISRQMVAVKATTEEKLGFTGARQGIKAYAVASAIRISAP